MQPCLEIQILPNPPLSLKTLLTGSALLLTIGLGGCTTLAKMGIGPSVADPGTRTTSGRLNDMNLAQSVRVDIYRDEPGAREANIEVVSFYQAILLVGEVPKADMRDKIGAIAKRYNDAKVVHNELTVAPNRSLGDRFSDDLLERKAGFSLLTGDGLPSDQIRLVAVKGTLYMMGKLTAREADRAVQRLQALDGIKRIVKIIDVLPEPQPQQSPASAS